VDIGGGTTDIAVISLGGIVVSRSLRVGGDKFDEAIIRFLRKQHNLAIGEQTAEKLKIQIATCDTTEEEKSMVLRGRDLIQGLPRQIEIDSGSIRSAITDNVTAIVDGVKNVLEVTPPELAADIIDGGIVLTGGGAMLRGLPELIARETQINCFASDDPTECVAVGTGKALAEIENLKSSGRSGILAINRRGRRRR